MDVEKGHDEKQFSSGSASSVAVDTSSVAGVSYQNQSATLYRKLASLSAKLDSLGVEIYGVQRRLPEHRHGGHYRQILTTCLLWVSGSGGLTSFSAYVLGPLIFGLGFKDCMSSAISATVVGCAVAAYGSTMGPRSGLRQMIGCRYQFGWHFAKVLALINIVTLLGWAVVSCVFGGQILAAISNSKVPLEIGILINAVLAFIIATVGLKFVQYVEGYAAIPMITTFLLLYVVSGPHFDTVSPSVGTSSTIIANWLSFFTSAVGTTGTWIAITSDYYVEFPENFAKWKTFLITFTCIFLPSVFVGILAIGIATNATPGHAWNDAWENLGTGGVLAASFEPWKGGGKFLLVVLYISLITNNIINCYSIALSLQVWGRWVTKIPRYIMTFVSAVIFFVLAMAGRNRLADILSNFLPMISYWCVMYVAVLLEENLIFRRQKAPGFNDAYDWRLWNDKSRLPWCFAGACAFLIGVPGAVLGMCQVYYVGPISKHLGEYGGDLGLFLSFGFTAISYPILRAIELRYCSKYGREPSSSGNTPLTYISFANKLKK